MKQLILIAVILLLPSFALAQDFCQGDFNYDGNVDANDVTEFLNNFGRSMYNNPCPFDGPAPVGRTGQTTSYYEGDDGHREKGVEWPVPRFLDEGDGTILDRLTGLIWLKNADCFGPRYWYDAMRDCNGLAHGQCGLTDGSFGGQWRLPHRFELESLLDLGNTPPKPAGNHFSNVQSFIYWSSTTIDIASIAAWTVHMDEGTIIAYGKILYEFHVWCVRGGR